MSKSSLRSRTSSTRSFSRRKRRYREEDKVSKPFDFCCSADEYDPLTKYNQRKPPYRSSLVEISSLHECSTLKFRTDAVEKRKFQKVKSSNSGDHFSNVWKSVNLSSSVRGPVWWFLEDEIALAKDALWSQRQNMHEEEVRRNIAIAKEKLKGKMRQIACPPWYQIFSIDQMRSLMTFQNVIRADYEEILTVRTQKAMRAIGITPTDNFEISSKTVRKLQKSCELNTVDFLQAIYKMLTGNSFEDEAYDKLYEPNEKIILSGIALLTLPRTVMELHKRLPSIVMPRLPPKRHNSVINAFTEKYQRRKIEGHYIPRPPIAVPKRKRGSPFVVDSQKLEWDSYKQRLQLWYEQCKRIPMPRVILPPEQHPLAVRYTKLFDQPKKLQKERKDDDSTDVNKSTQGKALVDLQKEKRDGVRKGDLSGEETEIDTPELDIENQQFSFTIPEFADKPGPVEYKICGTLKPPRPNTKSWLGEKDSHYIISGVSEDPPECPVTYEMTGIANMTPTNSDEKFLTLLNLGDGPKKIYPSGRENLSKKWQEWLQNADEEFRKIEREANKMIKNIQATMKLVFPDPTCDSCCSCRQTRRTHIRLRNTKTPYMVIDAVAEDNDKNKYIVGSMAMHSSPPSPVESAADLVEVIPSEDKIVNHVVINGITNEQGETRYYVTGHIKDKVHVSSKIIEPPPPPPLRNVPPCACAVQQMFNKKISPTLSSDNISWTKTDGLCFGKKYRPGESAAYSCKEYPGDRSCRRNPFTKGVAKLKRKLERDETKKEDKEEDGDHPPREKRMYSVADFKPCGDEPGMAVCGGEWGTLHTLTPKELEEQDQIRREILKGPPCGTKPGRAVCGGPWGATISISKQMRYAVDVGLDDEEEGEGVEDEEDEEGEEEESEKAVEEPAVVKKKPRRRDEQCYLSPESIASRKKPPEKKKARFIPDPNYHGYDDPWNVFRTAPTGKKVEENEYERSLRLSTPVAATTDSTKKIGLAKDTAGEARKSGKTRTSGDGPSTDAGDFEDTDRFKLASVGGKAPRRRKSKSKKISIKEAPSKSDDRSEPAGIKADSKKKKIEATKGKPKATITHEKHKKKYEQFPGTEKTVSGNKETTKRQKPKSGTTVDRTKDATRKEKTNLKDTETVNRRKPEKPGDRSNTLDKRKNEIYGKSKKQNSKGNTKRGKNTEAVAITERSKNTGAAKNTKQIENTEAVAISKQGKQKSSEAVKNGETKRTKGSAQKRYPEASKIHKVASHKGHSKRDKKKDTQDVSEAAAADLRRAQMDKLKTMMMSGDFYPRDVQPAVLPEEPRKMCQLDPRDKLRYSDESIATVVDESAVAITKGPCGWKTKSEQELPTEKNLVYLVDPDYPPESIPVRPGGKPCLCRENRNNKKIMLYNIGGHLNVKKDVEEKVGKMQKKHSTDKQPHLIDGVIYYTPPPSPRRSDEYVPEYDLYRSPYDMCPSRRRDKGLRLLERYTGPPSLSPKNLERSNDPCDCSVYIESYGIMDDTGRLDGSVELKKLQQDARNMERVKEELIMSKSPEERWLYALRDMGLRDYFTRCKDNVPCWLRCAGFDKIGCPISVRKLQAKRPVCECKYERKVLKHAEEKTKWEDRRLKLKSYKKQPFVNVVDTSRPIVPDVKLLISDVKRIPREDEYLDDVHYCINGVVENRSMAPPEQVVGGLSMATPVQTPEPSQHVLPCVCLHRHWSLTKIPPGPLPRKGQAEIDEAIRRKKAIEQEYGTIHEPEKKPDGYVGYQSCEEKCDVQKDQSKEKKSLRRAAREPNEEDETGDVAAEDKQKPAISFKKSGQTGFTDKIEKSSDAPRSNVAKEHGRKQTLEHSKDPHRHVHIKSTNPAEHPKWKKHSNEVVEDAKKRGGAKKVSTDKTDLIGAARRALKKMSEEGFLFAKLPKCHLLPELYMWLMYRKGFVFPDIGQQVPEQTIVATWNLMCIFQQPKIPVLNYLRTITELGI